MVSLRTLWLIILSSFLLPTEGLAVSMFDKLSDIKSESWQCIGTKTKNNGQKISNVVGQILYMESDGNKTYQFSTEDWIDRQFHHPANKEPTLGIYEKCRFYRDTGQMIIGTQGEAACQQDRNRMNFRFNRDNGEFIFIWENPIFENKVVYAGSCF